MIATFCSLCRQPLDVTGPHSIVDHDYAHLECADKLDSRDLGAIDVPDDFAADDFEVEEELSHD